MIVTISYTGNLTAYITVLTKPVRMKTLEDLADSDLIFNYIDYGNSVPTTLRDSEGGVLKKLSKKLVLLENQAYGKAFDEVKSGKAALGKGIEYLRYWTVIYNVSNIYYLPEIMITTHTGWIYQKHTPWRYKFDAYLDGYLSAGLPIYWRNGFIKKFYKEMNYSEQGIEQQGVRKLTLEDLQAAFIIYAIGIVISVLVGTMEIVQGQFTGTN